MKKAYLLLQQFWTVWHLSILINVKKNIQKVDLQCRRKYFNICPVSEFNEFEPRLKSAQNRFQLSAGLNLVKLNTILSGTNHI